MTKKTKIIIAIAIVICLFLASIIFLGSYTVYKIIKNYNNSNANYNYDDNSYNGASIDLETSDSLEKFTDKEFTELEESYKEKYKTSATIESTDNSMFDTDFLGLGEANEESTVTSPDSAAKVAGDNENITNVQEQGVDEGDIVKAYGDYLVVLSRGRLFTIQVKENEQELLKPVYKGEAYAKGSTLGTWYDEMLIYQNTVVVVGYSYSASATEIGLFKISDNGSIVHQDTYFIDSNDYYSSRNYASRLVENDLIFYMPYYLYWDYTKERFVFPQIKKWLRENELSEGQNIINTTDIYKPVQDTSTMTLHTVVTCDLNNGFDCSAEAILGPYARNFYVSADNVYVWVAENNWYYNTYDDTDDQTKTEPNAFVYKMPLDDETEVSALKTYGFPVDQFSFKQSADGFLNVVVQEHGFGDAMWNPEHTDSGLALLRVALDDFKQKPKTCAVKNYRSLPELEGYAMQNRFVGDYLIYGSSSSWWDQEVESTAFITDYTGANLVQSLELKSSVDRIEVLDNNNAVIVGKNGANLDFNWIALSNASILSSKYTMADVTQAESRSHGFFYSASEGVLGLPVIDDFSKIVYLDVNLDNKTLSSLGTLDAKESSVDTDDDCLYSCTDWYGNSRPIFYKSRIFALMGYELVEGEVAGNQITEKQRVNYYNPAR